MAGGITGCKDWQNDAISQLSSLPICIFNPRRHTFDPKSFSLDRCDPEEQITWEFEMLNRASVIVFYFPEESVCPIALYELGRFNALAVNLPRQKIFVGTHPGYPRRKDVEIQTWLATGKEIHPDFESLMKSTCDYLHQVLFLTSDTIITK